MTKRQISFKTARIEAKQSFFSSWHNREMEYLRPFHGWRTSCRRPTNRRSRLKEHRKIRQNIRIYTSTNERKYLYVDAILIDFGY